MAHPSKRLALRALDRADAILGPLKERLETNRQRVDDFIAQQGSLSWTTPRAGSVGLVYFQDGDIDALIEKLEARDALVVPGHFLGAPNAFCIGYGMPSEILEEGLAHLGDALVS